MSQELQQIANYLREIAHVPSLTDAEVRQLIQSRAETLQRVAQAYLYLVVPIAREYIGQGREVIDLVRQGNIALLQAIETFDASGQELFSTYAERSIRTALVGNQAEDA
jgi:DNA-directed RNA polymerase sigma subunit (sigma70/sigma32)